MTLETKLRFWTGPAWFWELKRSVRGPAFDGFLAFGLYKKAIRKFLLVKLVGL